jgi:hypothetical protein
MSTRVHHPGGGSDVDHITLAGTALYELDFDLDTPDRHERLIIGARLGGLCARSHRPRRVRVPKFGGCITSAKYPSSL